MDHAPPSNPQGSFGPALVAKLAPFFASAQANQGAGQGARQEDRQEQ
jgi:hypothetical protein